MSFTPHNALHDTHNLIKNAFFPQIILPELAKEIGLEESIVLNQIHYWLQRSNKMIDGEPWIYNTFENWQKQFSYWSLSKVKRIFASLQQTGLIISQKKNKYLGSHTKWYKINYTQFYALLEKIKPESYCKIQNNDLSTENNTIISHMPYTEIVNSTTETSIGQGEAKKFALVQDELSSSQFDTTITDNNLTDNINCMSNEVAVRKKSWLNTLHLTRQTFDFSKEDLQITDQLMQIWSEVFIHPQKAIVLYDKRRAKLLHAWQNHFVADFAKWREFCLAINSSKFLMGEKKTGFKAHFDWLLEEKTIVKIRAGEFDIGDRIPDIEQQHHAEEKAKTASIVAAKLAELQAKKQQAEREAEIKRLAAKLEWSALETIENSWSDKEIEQAKQEFEQYLFADEDEYGLHHYRDIFNQGRWQEPMINFAFTSFKRQRYLSKTSDTFVLEATEKYFSLEKMQY